MASRNNDPEKLGLSGGRLGKQLSSLASSGSAKPFRRGVVWEYLQDPMGLSPESMARLMNKGASRDMILSAPPRSLIIQPVGGVENKALPELLVAFPFWSHIAVPAKAGEQVWWFAESDVTAEAPVWWFSRVTMPYPWENTNYAHNDRQFWAAEEASYPNGAGDEASKTLDGPFEAFDRLIRESESTQDFAPQASPALGSTLSGSAIAGSHRNLVRCDWMGGTGISELVAGLPEPNSRQSSRFWDELDPSSNPSPPDSRDAAARVWVGEAVPSATPRSLDLFMQDWSTGFEASRPLASKGGVAMLEAKDNVTVAGEVSATLCGLDSYLHLQGGQAVLRGSRAIVDAETLLLLRDESKTLLIGGVGADQPLALGGELRQWQEELLSTLNDLIDALESAVLPTALGPAPFRAASGTREGVLSLSTALAKRRVAQLRNRIPKHLSSMARINSDSLDDQ